MSSICYPPSLMSSVSAFLATDEKSEVSPKTLIELQFEIEESWFLCVWFSASFSVDDDTETEFEIQVDGFPLAGASVFVAKLKHGTVSMVLRVGSLPDGVHTLSVVWKSPLAVALCYPVSFPGTDNASLVAQVVTV